MECINIWPKIMLNAAKECSTHEECGTWCNLYVEKNRMCLLDYVVNNGDKSSIKELEKIAKDCGLNIENDNKKEVPKVVFSDTGKKINMLQLVENKLHEIFSLFEAKNAQYSTADPFANFTTGANLMFGCGDINAKYSALKAYVAKHIAHVYNNQLTGPKVKESIGDIAVYFIIAWIMADLAAEEQENEAKEVSEISKDSL